MRDDRAISRIAERMHGLIPVHRLDDLGISADVRSDLVIAGRWSAPEPGVIKIGGSPSTWHQRVLAAAMTEHGFASHRTAAALWRLEGFERRIIEVTTGRWERRPNLSVKIHENTRMTGADVTEVDGIPCTTIEWTLIHLGAVVPPVKIEVALDDALRRHLTTPEKLWQVFQRVAGRGVRGCGVIRPLLVRRLGTSGRRPNGFEKRLYRILERAGLPLPVAQLEIRDGDFVAYADWGYAPERLVIECVSDEWHNGRVRRNRDVKRRNQIINLDYEVLEFTDDHVKREHEWVAKTVLTALERGRRHLA